MKIARAEQEKIFLISHTLDFIFKVFCGKICRGCMHVCIPFHVYETFFCVMCLVDASSSCNRACDGFLMRGSVWQVKCSYRFYFSWLALPVSTLFLLTSVSIRLISPRLTVKDRGGHLQGITSSHILSATTSPPSNHCEEQVLLCWATMIKLEKENNSSEL